MNLENEIDIDDYNVIEFIKELVRIYFNAPQGIYERKTRKPELLQVKQYAAYFVTRHTCTLNQKDIADVFKFKNHGSISHICSKIELELEWDKSTKKIVNDIESLIKLKGKAIGARVDLENYYYINMDNFASIRENSERAVIFVGYSDDEIKDFASRNGMTTVRKHKSTKKYILELKNK